MKKNNKGKPTRKDIDTAISNLHQGLMYMGQKIEHLEGYAKSTEMALDLYTKFSKTDKAFMKYVDNFNKKQEEETTKKEKELNKKIVKETEKA
tara:strand:+ start:37 stop:315 length:279 start_codon:yes stop_codon:yes gene_type:complete